MSMPKYQQIKNDFMHHLEITNRAQGTVEAYLSNLDKLCVFMHPKSVLKTSQEDIHKFQLYLKKYYKITTIKSVFAALNIFFDFVKQQYGFNDTLKMPNIRTPLKNGKDIDSLNREEYKKIIEQASIAGDKRFVALFTTLLFTGARISEVLQMEVSQVNDDWITVKGKGGVLRSVYLSHPEIKKSLKGYLPVRKQPYSSTTKALFVGERGPITRQTADRLMKKYANLAGIDYRKAHCHITRHTFVKMCVENGLTLSDTADLVGHRDVNSTRYYLEKPKDEYSELARNLKWHEDVTKVHVHETDSVKNP